VYISKHIGVPIAKSTLFFQMATTIYLMGYGKAFFPENVDSQIINFGSLVY